MKVSISHASISVECLFSMTLLPIHPDGETCFDLGQVSVLNDPVRTSV